MPTRSAYAPGTFCWADVSSTDAEASRRLNSYVAASGAAVCLYAGEMED